MPTGGNPYGNGVPILVVEVTPHQGDWENQPQGEGGQVTVMQTDGEVCVLQGAITVRSIIRDYVL